ncbi:MAG: Gfo/Idh/MocA family oxidoreductase [Bacteroidota bacterium]
MKSNRRNFVKNTALAIGGLSLGPSLVSASNMQTSETLRVGVIGTGSRGKGLMHTLGKVGNFEVTACCDILPFRLDEAREIAPKAKKYKDYDKLLADKNIDAVIIATPFGTHDEVALAAIDAGKHIYCEKTMVRGMEEIQNVVTKASQSDKVFQTGHQYHSSPLYKNVREVIRGGYIGDITAFVCQWNRNGDWRRPVPNPKFERIINWRMYKEHSGGLIAELMAHQIDFINWVLDEPPEKMVGFGGIDHWKDGRETYDNIHLMAEYPSKVDATFSCTTTNGYEDYQVKILGQKATVLLGYNKATIYAEPSALKEKGFVDGVSGATLKAWEQGEGMTIPAPGDDPTVDALQQFYNSVVNGEPVVSSLETGANTSKCVQMALDAVHGGEIKYWKDYPELKFS